MKWYTLLQSKLGTNWVVMTPHIYIYVKHIPLPRLETTLMPNQAHNTKVESRDLFNGGRDNRSSAVNTIDQQGWNERYRHHHRSGDECSRKNHTHFHH